MSMTTLGLSLIGVGLAGGVYGFAWALCRTAAGDRAPTGPRFQQFDVEAGFVDTEFARIAAELEDVPFDQEKQ